jgi:hypothetical protein
MPISRRGSREKVFGPAGEPLERNVKAPTVAYVKGDNAWNTQPHHTATIDPVMT